MAKRLLILINCITASLLFTSPLYAQYVYQSQMGAEALGLIVFESPSSVVVDAEGNIYVADKIDDRIQKFDPSGKLLLKFGSQGTADGEFRFPTSITLDAAGNIYVADQSNHRIQKFDVSGNFLLKFGSHGIADGQLNYPAEVAVDTEGNIYVADYNNHRIQKFASDGSFILKFGSQGSADGQFISPKRITVDAYGNVYVADSNNARIQKFTSDGSFILKFGSYGTAAGQFRYPAGVTIDSAGNIYVADQYNNRIQKFDASGNFLLMFGTSGKTDGQFWNPAGVAIDDAGSIYVADEGNHRVQKFDANSNFLLKFGTDGSGAADGLFFDPSGVAVDAEGNIYVADSNNSRIQKFTSDGSFSLKFVSPVIFDGLPYYPAGITLDAAGNIYVADQSNDFIQKFDVSGNFLLKFGSNGRVDGQLFDPSGVAVDTEGNIYVADKGNHQIQKFDATGNLLLKFGSQGTADGEFRHPTGVTVDAAGNVYVADSFNNRIQKFTSDGSFVLKFGSLGTTDGKLKYPTATTLDSEGNIFVADRDNHRIQKFDANGNFLLSFGSRGVNEGEFIVPTGVAVDTDGNVYVADRGNHRIQKFSPYTDDLHLFADSVAGYPEEEVEVQVKANDFADIISAQATLEWDPQVAELLTTEAGTLAQVQFNTQTSDQGKMTFSWYEGSDAEGLSLSDSAVLFTLRFKLVGEPKAQTVLSFTSSLIPLEVADKKEKTVKVTTQAGKLYILPLQTISGRIFTEASQAVKEVAVKLTGYASDTDSTNAEGKYSLTGVHPYQSYKITASKVLGTSVANGLTSLDLAILQRHILQTETLTSPYKLIAADVNLSQSITTADIRDIQDVVLGNTTRLAKGKHWTFIPKHFVFDPAQPYAYDTVLVHEKMPAPTGHDFIAIKLGDVNDTWNPAKGRLQQKQLMFLVEEHETISQSTITIPVRVEDFKDVSSFQLTLEWDEKVLAFESAQGGALPDIVFGEKYVQEGQLTVLWYNRQGSSSSLSDEQAVFTVTFQTIGKIGDQSVVTLSSARTPLLAYDATNIAMTTEAIAGSVDIVEVLSAEQDLSRPTTYKIYQNEPNPFSEEVKFRFGLPQQSKVSLKVMNAAGQVFHHTEGAYAQGTHIISWDGRNAQGVTIQPGVYFLQLTAGSFHQTIKIIKK